MNSIIVFCAQYLFLFVIAGVVIAWLQTTKNLKLHFLTATILAGAVAYIISRLASKLYYDPRPFVSQHVKPLIAHQIDNGFPSDHALLTGTLTAITYFYNRKIAIALAGLTLVIGIARVLAKVHSPLDIIAGWAIGLISAVAAYYLTTWLFKKHSNN